jgi:hypothetical protein
MRRKTRRESEISMTKLGFAIACFASLTVFADPKKHVATQADLQWQQPFGPKGPSFGFVEGKMGDKHPATFFAKMTAGGDSGWHYHDEEYVAVVVQGTFTEQQQGEANETQLPVGSYFTQPGKKVHRNGCLKGADCLIYVHFEKGANSVPTTADGKVVKP